MSKTRLTRIAIPVALILIWLVGAAVGGPYFGKIEEVSSNDQTTFLPESADATQVQALLGEFSDSDAIPAIVVFVGDTELTEAELTSISDEIVALTEIEGVGDEVSPAIPSEDGMAVQAFVPISSDGEIAEVVTEVGDELRANAPAGVEVFVTDPQAEAPEALHEYGVQLLPWDELPRADGIVAAVAHKEFATLSLEDIGKKLVKGGAFIDVKAAFDAKAVQEAGYKLWRL